MSDQENPKPAKPKAATKSTAKKAAARKGAAKKSAVKQAAKKSAAKKASAKKTSAKKASAKKAVAKKAAAKKSAVRKNATKTTAKKAAGKTRAPKPADVVEESPDAKPLEDSQETFSPAREAPDATSPDKKEVQLEVVFEDPAEVVRDPAERRRPRKPGKPEMEPGDITTAEDEGGEPKVEDREPEPKPDIPERLDVDELRARSLADLLELASTLPVRLPAFAGKSQVIFEIIAYYASEGCHIEAEGVLEQAKDSFGLLRDPKRSFKNAPDDFYVGSNLIREHALRPGQLVRVKLRAPRERDKYLSAVEILTVEGMPAAEYEEPKDFDQLTSLFPDERFVLECDNPNDLAVRLIDLVAPLGKGARGLIVAPPRGGKTILLKQIARSIQNNNPDATLIILLLDERPEEVTDFEETVDADVFSSTFDEPSKRHAQVSDLVLERGRRLVELGRDVVILLDSLTRLARGYNNAQRGGPIGSGGLSPAALAKSRKFFGAARNVEEGGSLTILATCLVETESRMDDAIFEELKGTGNMEIRLDQDLAERRIYPAIHIPQSGTRNDDRLYHPDEMQRVIDLRRQLTGLPVGEAVDTLMTQLAKTGSNAEFLMRGLK